MERTKPGIESEVVAFLLAISAAAIMFPLVMIATHAVTLLWHSGFDMAVLGQMLTSPLFKPLYLLFEVVVIWFIALISGVVPYVLCVVVVRKCEQYHWQYFVTCGVLTAACPSFLLMSSLLDWRGVSFLSPLFWQQYLSTLPGYLICGGTAGYVCWHYLRYRMLHRL